MLILALLAQAATPNDAVKIMPAGDDAYMLELITTESASAAVAKMNAAAEEACKSTGVGSTGMVILGIVGKKPRRHQIMQPIKCKPAGK